VLAVSPDGAVAGWSAVRGNAATTLLHIVHEQSGRVAFLTAAGAPAPPVADATDEPPAEDYTPPEPPPSAVAVVVSLLSSVAENPGEIDDPPLVCGLANILSACALEVVGRAVVVEAGGAAPLLALLPSEYDEVAEDATMAFAALAAEPAACVMLRGTPPPTEEEAPPPVDEADPPADTEAPAAEAAAAPPSPLEVVPSLLGRDSEALRRVGCVLVTAACVDATNAATLVSLKVLPLLVDLAKQSPFAAPAISALCLAMPAALLWYRGALPPSVSISDGFYAVTRDTELLAVSDLAATNTGTEVLLVDSASDPHLAQCVAMASELVAAQTSAGAAPAETAAGIARLVCDRMGGAVPYELYQHYDQPAAAVDALRTQLASRVLPIGSLSVGGARHRATLFKALVDATGAAACSLVMGACVRGAHAHHAWNMMILDGAEVVVDLLHAPGELYSEGSDAARRYQRIDEHAFASLTADGSVYGARGG